VASKKTTVDNKLEEMIRKCVEEGICDFKSHLDQLGKEVKEVKSIYESSLKNLSEEIKSIKSTIPTQPNVEPIKEDIQSLSTKLNEIAEAMNKTFKPTEEEAKQEQAPEEKHQEDPKSQADLSQVTELLGQLKELREDINKLSQATTKKPTEKNGVATKNKAKMGHVHRNMVEVLTCPICGPRAIKQLKEAIHNNKIDPKALIGVDSTQGTTTNGEATTNEPTQAKQSPKKSRFYELFIANKN